VRACCSKVCKEYKQYIYEAIGLTIMSSSIALDRCEKLIKHPPIKLKNKTFAIIDGVRVIT
jgi:hypothetical protein